MRTVYKSESKSSGRPWYQGSDKFWVRFSSEVSVECAKARKIKNGAIFLSRRMYLVDGNEDKKYEEFYEYEFSYIQNGKKCTRQHLKKMLNYKHEFEEMIK